MYHMFLECIMDQLYVMNILAAIEWQPAGWYGNKNIPWPMTPACWMGLWFDQPWEHLNHLNVNHPEDIGRRKWWELLVRKNPAIPSDTGRERDIYIISGAQGMAQIYKPLMACFHHWYGWRSPSSTDDGFRGHRVTCAGFGSILP